MRKWHRVTIGFMGLLGLTIPSLAQTIVDEWATVKAPRAPELKPVAVEQKGTALLMLDFLQQSCNQERRPRCVASIPKVQRLLTEAREKGVQVIHSLVSGTTAANLVSELAAKEGEPIVTSGPDKFIGTELEQILAARGIRRVIVVGTAANGAVLHTASGAALRGLDVVVPVDGMSAVDTYAEQYTAWHLASAPRMADRVALTRVDLVRF